MALLNTNRLILRWKILLINLLTTEAYLLFTFIVLLELLENDE